MIIPGPARLFHHLGKLYPITPASCRQAISYLDLSAISSQLSASKLPVVSDQWPEKSSGKKVGLHRLSSLCLDALQCRSSRQNTFQHADHIGN
jgi:hypothetical protein